MKWYNHMFSIYSRMEQLESQMIAVGHSNSEVDSQIEAIENSHYKSEKRSGHQKATNYNEFMQQYY